MGKSRSSSSFLGGRLFSPLKSEFVLSGLLSWTKEGSPRSSPWKVTG